MADFLPFKIALCPLAKPEELYAFSYNPKTPEGSRETGWKSIDVKADYLRMGIESSSWEISNINKDYEVSLHLLWVCYLGQVSLQVVLDLWTTTTENRTSLSESHAILPFLKGELCNP